MNTTLFLRSALAYAVLTLTACSMTDRRTDHHAHAWPPQPRALSVAPADRFVYAPSVSGHLSRNRIENTAVSNIVLKQNIDVLTHDSIAHALRTAGFDTGTPYGAYMLSGRIERLLADDARVPCRWTLTIRYDITDTGSGRIVYSATKTVRQQAGKLTNPLDVLDDIVKASVQSLIDDPEFQRVQDQRGI